MKNSTKKIINVVVIVLVLTFAVGSIALFTNGFNEESLVTLESKIRIMSKGDEIQGYLLKSNIRDFKKEDFDKLIKGVDGVEVKNTETDEIECTQYTLIEFESCSDSTIEEKDFSKFALSVFKFPDNSEYAVALCFGVDSKIMVVGYDSELDEMHSLFEEMSGTEGQGPGCDDIKIYSNMFFEGAESPYTFKIKEIHNATQINRWIGGIYK